MRKSINEWMVIRKVLAERRGDLKELRQTTAVKTKTIHTYTERETVVETETQYDSKAIDRRITEMQNADLIIDSAIKQSNASTLVELPLDVDKLLSPME